MLSQEDFDPNTSVDTDVVKKTDAKLDPMPGEGGERPRQEQVRRQTNELIPFYFPQDIEFIILWVRTRFEDGLFQRQNHNLATKLVDTRPF